MPFSRTELLLGKEGVEKLKKAHVAVFGVGGVGGYAVEALVRSGVGELTLIDKDVVSPSNLNRQIIALYSTLGQKKTEVFAARAREINPAVKVHTYDMFYLPENADGVDFSPFDYVVDAVDTVSAKIEIIAQAKGENIPVISAMGAGNKLDPTKFEVTDISKTTVCPLARVMRRELKKRGVEDVKVVYSKEEPIPSGATDGESGKPIAGSIAFVPSVAGLIIAGEVIKDLVK